MSAGKGVILKPCLFKFSRLLQMHTSSTTYSEWLKASAGTDPSNEAPCKHMLQANRTLVWKPPDQLQPRHGGLGGLSGVRSFDIKVCELHLRSGFEDMRPLQSASMWTEPEGLETIPDGYKACAAKIRSCCLLGACLPCAWPSSASPCHTGSAGHCTQLVFEAKP